MAIERVDFPMNSMVIFRSYVQLQESTTTVRTDKLGYNMLCDPCSATEAGHFGQFHQLF